MPDDPLEPSAPPAPLPRRAPGPVRRVLAYSRGLILDQGLRRQTMFYVILAAMLMAFAGEVLFGGWLKENLWRFLTYYLACAWLTAVAALLAIYDILMLRLQHRVTRRRLRSDLLGDEHDDPR